jgi:hypothetical protein
MSFVLKLKQHDCGFVGLHRPRGEAACSKAAAVTAQVQERSDEVSALNAMRARAKAPTQEAAVLSG